MNTSNADILTAAIRAETVVQFRYPSHGVLVLRTFSPWEMAEDGESLLGYDHGREGIRRFSISKITGEIVPDDGADNYVQPQS
jgi:predicted DNA-binding transcriptional regulator YafY